MLKLFELRTAVGTVVHSTLSDKCPSDWPTPIMKSFGFYVTERDVSEPRKTAEPWTFDMVPKHDNCRLAPCSACSAKRPYHTEICSCHHILNRKFVATPRCLRENMNENKLIQAYATPMGRVVVQAAFRYLRTPRVGDYLILPRGYRDTTRYRVEEVIDNKYESGLRFITTFAPRTKR